MSLLSQNGRLPLHTTFDLNPGMDSRQGSRSTMNQLALEPASLRKATTLVSQRILLVEQDLNLLARYTELLKNAGHSVHQARTVLIAYELSDQHGYDLCFSNLEVKSRGDVLLIVRLHTMCYRQQFRLMIVSSHESSHAICQELGVEFHAKPISNKRLLWFVERGAVSLQSVYV